MSTPAPGAKRLRRRLCHTCGTSFQPPTNYYGGFCELHRNDVRRTEAQRVLTAVLRAQQHGTPASLTTDQWIATLDAWDWKCAYCGGPYQVLEHVIEIRHGGGTTQGNIVPSCTSCNGAKRHFRSGLYKNMQLFISALEGVLTYLEPFKTTDDIPFQVDEADETFEQSTNSAEQDAISVVSAKTNETVLIHGQPVIIALLEDDSVGAGIKGLCAMLGVTATGQMTRITSESMLASFVKRTPLPTKGGNQPSLLLDVEALEFWLYTLSTGKIPERAQHVVAMLRNEHRFTFKLSEFDDPIARFNKIIRQLQDPSE